MGSGELYSPAPLIRHPDPPFAMSQHNSLQGARGIVVKRNVLKRFERIALLKKRGQWKDGERVVGLRKTMPEA
jgi:small basic protein (TIGR04137 family)